VLYGRPPAVVDIGCIVLHVAQFLVYFITEVHNIPFVTRRLVKIRMRTQRISGCIVVEWGWGLRHDYNKMEVEGSKRKVGKFSI
jgi:hypothetical protein